MKKEILLNEKMNSTKIIRDNKKSVVLETALIAGILLINAIVFSLTGYGIPCVFKLVTGLQCPGCGMTHAYLELIEGNLAGAITFNILSVTLMPVLLVYLIYKGIVLFKTGSTRMKSWENVFLVICCIIAGAFFVYRNITALISHPFFRAVIASFF